MEILEKIFGIKIDNRELYERALTHPSYVVENELTQLDHYERLEFLGDAVLKLAISDIMFKQYPDYTEGQLSKIRSIIVSDNMLAKISEELGLCALIKLAKHEEKQGHRDLESIRACSFEALLGAFYLDGKMSELLGFLKKVFLPRVENIQEEPQRYNAKAVLQEYTQATSKDRPVYNLVGTAGPEHNKRFKIEVVYQNQLLGTGFARTKKEAEQMAAFEACRKLGISECKEQ